MTDLPGDRDPSYRLPVGKLPADLLNKIINVIDIQDPQVLIGPGIGLDCALVETHQKILAIKSDPITFTAQDIGWYAVQVNANDIATTGAVPRWMLATLLLPETSATSELVEQIQIQLNSASQAIGVTLIGGHTEITTGLDRPIVIVTMIGEVERGSMIIPTGIQEGDSVLITKGVPIEATAILASEFSNEILAKDPTLRPADLEAAQEMLFQPGISVLKDAQIAIRSGRVHAMHDPTEGGLYAAAWEFAQASSFSMWIDPLLVPVPPLSKRICKSLAVDPLGAIASGALLIACPPEDAKQMITDLGNNGITCSRIGAVLENSTNPKVYSDETPTSALLPRPERDEIARIFEQHRS
jgi:hydrogenase expression/formation protein HypE